MAATKFNVQAYVDALNEGDAEKVASFYADDVEYIRSPLDEPLRSRHEVRDRMEMFLTSVTDARFEPHDVVQQNDKAAFILHYAGKHTGPLEFMPGKRVSATNKKLDFDLAQFLTLNGDGKITRDVGVYDVLEVLQQMGVSPETAVTPRAR